MKYIGLAIVCLFASLVHADRPACWEGHEDALKQGILTRLGVLAERTKKISHVDYKLQDLVNGTQIDLRKTDSSPSGDLEADITSAYTVANGTELTFRVTDKVDDKPDFQYASKTLTLLAEVVGQKVDKLGNIIDPGHCDIHVGWFYVPTVLTLFNAKTGVVVNRVDLASEVMRLY